MIRNVHPIVGLDLDNTLIDYDAVFGAVGVELGVLPEDQGSAAKAAVRAYLQRRADGETDWMRLQGQVYGRHIERARLFDGVAAFIDRLRSRGCEFVIISHKTRYGHFDLDRIDLWEAARGWLDARGFFDPERLGLNRDRVWFEETREGKLARIAEIGCDLFIDDLPEVLLHPDFSPHTEPLWFAGEVPGVAGDGLVPYHNWQELTEAALAALSRLDGPRRGRARGLASQVGR
jgi:hypothetical protein